MSYVYMTCSLPIISLFYLAVVPRRSVSGHTNTFVHDSPKLSRAVMAEVNGRQKDPDEKSKKKRWYGDRPGGGVKTALGIKRKPNRKDRLKARGQGVLPQ